MLRVWRIEGVLLAATLGLARAPSARAESATPAGDTGGGTVPASPNAERLAETHFHAGIALARRGEWQTAEREFDASYSLYPTPSALSNKARCLQNLGDTAAALSLYEQVLHDFGDRLEADERAWVESACRDLAPLVGSINLEGVPPNAAVTIDGHRYSHEQLVGGVRLKTGEHVVRVLTDSAVFERAISVPSAGSITLQVELQPKTPATPRSLPPPERQSPPSLRRNEPLPLTVEGMLGLVFARSFDGTAEASCSKTSVFADGTSAPGCSEQSRPFGGTIIGRVGYRIAPGVAVEAALGYLSASRRLTRSLEVQGEDARLGSRAAEDRLRLSGGLLMAGASYQVLRNTPLLARLSVGLFAARQTASVRGHFSATSRESGSTGPEAGELALTESPELLWIPALSPELRGGIRITDNLTLDLGVTVFLLFAPSRVRSGDAWQQQHIRRWPLMVDGVAQGVVELSNEISLGTIIAVAPNVGARWEF